MDHKTMSLAIIPARGGSKGIPRKNIQVVGGKPLIAWTIEAALGAGAIPFVSTDDHEIGQVALQHGARILERPEELAVDTVHAFDVVAHALDELQVPDDERVMMLLPTSPLRTSSDINVALGLLQEHHSVVGITDVGPGPSLRVMGQFYMHPIVPFGVTVSHQQRQVTASYYKVNGAMFLAHANTLRNYGTYHIDLCIPMRMPLERSIDINEQSDLFLADKLLRLKQNEKST